MRKGKKINRWTNVYNAKKLSEETSSLSIFVEINKKTPYTVDLSHGL